MSAGEFQYKKYAADAGGIYRIRVQPETLLASIGGNANSEATGSITQSGTVRVRGSKRSFGGVARRITLKWTGSPPTDYKVGALVTIPILQKTVYDGIDLGDTGTYLGAGVEVVGKIAESFR